MFEITTRRSSKKGIDVIIVNQNERTLRFNGKASIKLERAKRESPEDEANLFDCLNEYLESNFTTEQKLELFKLFERAHVIVDNGKILHYEDELAQIKPITDEILDFINVPKYCEFIHYSKYLKVPKDLGEAASKGDYPKQTTISDTDYVDMVKFAFVSRVIFPIIFRLISRFELAMGTETAETVCGEQLLATNDWIRQMKGWHKLEGYIEFAFGKRGVPTSADSVISNENFNSKVLFTTIFNRLCCAVIPETEEGKNLATAINSAVRQQESSNSGTKTKNQPTDGDEDKRSLYDKYQISESVKSSDETAQAEFFSFGLFDENDNERTRDLFFYQCKSLGIKNDKLVEKVYENLPPNWRFELRDHILKILQLYYTGVVSPFIFEACEYYQLMSAIALAQVGLSERGYTYLPSILGAIENPEGKRGLNEGLKLNTADRDFLVSICDVQSSNNEGKSFNEAVVSATEFLDNIANGRWVSNLEYGVLSDAGDIYNRVGKAKLFELEVSIEIKDEFLRLIREVNE